jgi:hypothetical protein
MRLPFAFVVKQGETFPPMTGDVDGERVTLHQPLQGRLPVSPLRADQPPPMWHVVELLEAVTPPVTESDLTVEGSPAYWADLIVVDIHRASFDRRYQREDGKPAEDPSITVPFDAVNAFLQRYRHLVRAGNVRPIDPMVTPWRASYLTDDGAELEPDPLLMRSRIHGRVTLRNHVLNSQLWADSADATRAPRPHAWQELILDLEVLRDEPGPALLVANAALESFGIWFSSALASRAGVDPSLWTWITNRGDWYKEPSVKDHYDPLLRAFTGYSLKDEPMLWEAFSNLRSVRNSFSHTGELVLGKARKPVSSATAAELVAKARQIVLWIEDRLPPELRRPQPVKVEVKQTHSFSMERPAMDRQVNQ